MTVVALASAKGSPGVTTSGLALTLAWPRPVVLAECDPAGGDVATGYLRHLELDGSHGLMQLVVAGLRGHAGRDLWAQLVDLDPPALRRLLLPGITTPAQAASLDAHWHHLAMLFASLQRLEPGFDVMADCGRLAAEHAPWPLLAGADLTLLAVRPRLSSLVPARTVVEAVRAGGPDSDGRVGLLLVGQGDYDDRAVARHLGVPVLARLPYDRRTARVLSGGGTVRMRRPLPRAARAAAVRLLRLAERRRESLTGRDGREATHASH